MAQRKFGSGEVKAEGICVPQNMSPEEAGAVICPGEGQSQTQQVSAAEEEKTTCLENE